MGRLKTMLERDAKKQEAHAQRTPGEKHTWRQLNFRIVRPMYDAIEEASKHTDAITALGTDPDLARTFANNTPSFMVFLMGVGIEVLGQQVRALIEEKEKTALVTPALPGEMAALAKHGLRSVEEIKP